LETKELVNRNKHTESPVSMYQLGVKPEYVSEASDPTTERIPSFMPLKRVYDEIS